MANLFDYIKDQNRLNIVKLSLEKEDNCVLLGLRSTHGFFTKTNL